MEFQESVDLGKVFEDNWFLEFENVIRSVPHWTIVKFADYYTGTLSDGVQGDHILCYKGIAIGGIDNKLGPMISINSILKFKGGIANNRRRALYCGQSYMINNHDELQTFVLTCLYNVFKDQLPTLNNVSQEEIGDFLKKLLKSGYKMRSVLFDVMPNSGQIGLVMKHVPKDFFLFRSNGMSYLTSEYKNALVDFLSYKSDYWDNRYPKMFRSNVLTQNNIDHLIAVQ